MFNNAKLLKMSETIDWDHVLSTDFPVAVVVLLGIISTSCCCLVIFQTCLKNIFKRECNECDIEELKVDKHKENKNDQDADQSK